MTALRLSIKTPLARVVGELAPLLVKPCRTVHYKNTPRPPTPPPSDMSLVVLWGLACLHAVRWMQLICIPSILSKGFVFCRGLNVLYEHQDSQESILMEETSFTNEWITWGFKVSFTGQWWCVWSLYSHACGGRCQYFSGVTLSIYSVLAHTYGGHILDNLCQDSLGCMKPTISFYLWLST